MGLPESGTRRQPSLDERLTRGSRIQSHVQGDRGLARTLRTVLLCFSRHRTFFPCVFTYIMLHILNDPSKGPGASSTTAYQRLMHRGRARGAEQDFVRSVFCMAPAERPVECLGVSSKFASRGKMWAGSLVGETR